MNHLPEADPSANTTMTQDQLTFTIRLIRLSRQRVGIKEAALLFALVDGADIGTLAQALRESKDTVKGKLFVLRSKKLAEAKCDPKGKYTYHLTARGKDIVNNTLSPA